MVTKELNYQSENECLVIRITKNDEYGWDVDIHQFPNPSLTGSYTDFSKLVDDIKPFILTNMTVEERIDFAKKLEELA